MFHRGLTLNRKLNECKLQALKSPYLNNFSQEWRESKLIEMKQERENVWTEN